MTRLILAAILLLLALPSPVGAECQPYPVGPNSPTGIVGCERYGAGIASRWSGPGAARNDCVYPWVDCQTISVRSLTTGLVIVVTPSMYGDLYLGDDDPTNDRIIDLDPAMVRSLGLDPDDGLWPVEVWPEDAQTGNPVLPDTAMEAIP